MKRHLIVTIHGIRTFGQWQERLEDMIRTHAAQSGVPSTLKIINQHYGFFSLVEYFFPWIRRIRAHWFARSLKQTILAFKPDRVDFVGHSFGTYCVGRALKILQTEKLNTRIETVILAGSVLRSNFDWQSMLDQGYVQRVVNECGTGDYVLMANHLIVPGGGSAGLRGFKGPESDNFRNRYHNFGHSGYFERLPGSTDPDEFMRGWLPYLFSEPPVTAVPHPGMSDVRAALFWFAGFLTPVKTVILSVCAFLAALGVENHLEKQREQARSASKREEIRTNEFEVEFKHQNACTHLIKALRMDPANATARAHLASLLHLRADAFPPLPLVMKQNVVERMDLFDLSDPGGFPLEMYDKVIMGGHPVLSKSRAFVAVVHDGKIEIWERASSSIVSTSPSFDRLLEFLPSEAGFGAVTDAQKTLAWSESSRSWSETPAPAPPPAADSTEDGAQAKAYRGIFIFDWMALRPSTPGGPRFAPELATQFKQEVEPLLNVAGIASPSLLHAEKSTGSAVASTCYIFEMSAGNYGAVVGLDDELRLACGPIMAKSRFIAARCQDDVFMAICENGTSYLLDLKDKDRGFKTWKVEGEVLHVAGLSGTAAMGSADNGPFKQAIVTKADGGPVRCYLQKLDGSVHLHQTVQVSAGNAAFVPLPDGFFFGGKRYSLFGDAAPEEAAHHGSRPFAWVDAAGQAFVTSWPTPDGDLVDLVVQRIGGSGGHWILPHDVNQMTQAAFQWLPEMEALAAHDSFLGTTENLFFFRKGRFWLHKDPDGIGPLAASTQGVWLCSHGGPELKVKRLSMRAPGAEDTWGPVSQAPFGEAADVSTTSPLSVASPAPNTVGVERSVENVVGMPKQQIRKLAISSQEQFLALADLEGCVRIYQAGERFPFSPRLPHAGWITCLKFSSDERSLWVGTSEGQVTEWSLPSPTLNCSTEFLRRLAAVVAGFELDTDDSIQPLNEAERRQRLASLRQSQTTPEEQSLLKQIQIIP